MALTFVQAVGITGSANANTQAVTVAATGTGNLLVACCFVYNPGDLRTVTGVSDGTSAFTQVPGVSNTGTTGISDMWYLPVSNNGKTTITMTHSGAAVTSYKEIFVVEISGFTNPTVDVADKAFSLTRTDPQNGQPVTTTAAIAAIVAHMVDGSVDENPASGNNFTSGGVIASADGVVTKLVSSTGTYTPAWGFTVATNLYWTTTTAFKESAAGGGGPLTNGGALLHGSLIRGGRLIS